MILCRDMYALLHVTSLVDWLKYVKFLCIADIEYMLRLGAASMCP